ncbi:MAG: hypothetical protein V3U45_05940 [bacterium]
MSGEVVICRAHFSEPYNRRVVKPMIVSRRKWLRHLRRYHGGSPP